MPTVLRVGGFDFSFYSNDHEPAHVHVRNADGVAVVEIATAATRRRLGNIRDRDVRRAEALVALNRKLLQAEWNGFWSKEQNDGR